MKKSHFKVVGRLDGNGRPMAGTVTVSRTNDIFSVRPARRRRTYDLPLATVADMVVSRIVKAEVFQRRLDRAAKRKK